MEKIWILNRNEELLTGLQQSGSVFLLDAVHKEQINGVNTFEFVIPSDHEKAQYVQEENIVLVKDLENDWSEFAIKEIEDEHSDGLFKKVYCEHASCELLDDVIRDIRPENRDAEYMLNQVLQDTRWNVGSIADTPNATHVFYDKSPLQCIHEVLELFGGELRFRTEFIGNQITNRYVDLLTQRGLNRGKRYVHGKDVTNVKRTVNTDNLVTALVGRGKGVENEEGTGYGRKLDFKDVVWMTPTNPVSKPLGQDWVGDSDALLQFGRPDGLGGLKHRTRSIDFEDEEDSTKLLERTWEALQEMKEPVFSYELSVIDLHKAHGYEHEFVTLGDTVAVIDQKFNPELRLTARILEMERDLINPQNTKIVLGNVFQYSSNVERQLQIRDKVLDQTINTSWLDGFIDALQNEVVGGAGTVRHSSDGLLILDKPAEQNPTKAILMNNGIIALSNTRVSGGDPGTAGGWDFSNGTFITGDGAFADKIVAGTMLADRIRGGDFYLGGVVNGIGKDGKFYLVNAEDDIVCQMDAQRVGFDRLFVGTLSGNNVVTKNFENITYYVNPVTGSDNNDGLATGTAFRSLQMAIDQIPEINEGVITINIASSSTLNEVIELKGKSGSGRIVIDFGNSTLNGYIRIGSCLQRITLKNGTIIHNGEQHFEDSSVYSCVRVLVSNWVVLDNMTCHAKNLALYCVAAEGGNMVVTNSRCFGATDSLVYATVGSAIKVVDVGGTGTVGLKASDSSIIAGFGYRPDTTTPTANPQGGQVTGVWGSTDPGGTAPGTSQPGKKTWTATSAYSWDTSFGWNGAFPRQGDPSRWSPGMGLCRGLWFFNYSDIVSTLSGKTVQSIRIYIERESKGGIYTNVPIHFWTHNNTGATGGQPTLSNSAGSLASFKPGEKKWVTLPTSLGNALKAGTAKGIAIFINNSNSDYYAKFKPSATLEITYT
ncbi:phage minor structural protein, N-terminal region [Seinonella peptonophila]|uniref:Phage minor structural protein, N-terminal region n=1 Tax=Seinonella peptonophila TaxID=112248 RepID=A0A1M4VAY9_9BACL|nr:phage tail protein [Seinonella peptonophila]SHE66047.1 phage minor structural protein, N-terminal region [Seinonella peptonophila]